ncbi:MAG: VOC family protein [Solirubrobacteraceae bacterium]
MSLIHTCYRILEIDRSVAFYEALGFKESGRLPIHRKDTSAADRPRPDAEPAAKPVEAINVFMNLPEDGDQPRLELTYNVGRTEPYEIGTGYGHIAITTADLDATLQRLAGVGIEPERPPYSVREGGSRLCFVRDPDGYRIEIIERAASEGTAG